MAIPSRARFEEKTAQRKEVYRGTPTDDKPFFAEYGAATERCGFKYVIHGGFSDSFLVLCMRRDAPTMIKLPDFKKAFDYENNFYLTSASSRVGKAAAHYELFKMINELGGDIVECGVFKGASLLRFASLQDLFGKRKRKIIGFDTFASFPETAFKRDISHRQAFIDDAGLQSISRKQLLTAIRKKGIAAEVELVEGDIVKTVPAYVHAHPALRIALINLDTDIYEPAVTVLTHLYPRLLPGGVLIADDYRVFPGETRVIDEFLRGTRMRIQNFPGLKTPHFIVKK